MGYNALAPWHLILILAIVLILFGPSKLSGLGAAIGKSIREFRQATQGPEAPTTTAATIGTGPSGTTAPATTPVAPVAAVPVALTCGRCNAALQPSHRFCPECGTAVGVGAPEGPVPAVAVAPAASREPVELPRSEAS